MDIKERLQSRITGLYERIERVVTRFHRTYLFLVCIFALVGYAFVLLFPALVVISISNISEILNSEVDIVWLELFTWLFVLLFSAQTSYHLAITKPVPAVGFTMPESKIPKIYTLVKKLQSHYKRPDIHKIIITANYEMDIVKTPRWMLPVWSSNTLIIGLPLLICMSPKQFERMMARKIGQFSKQTNPLTNWLYQLTGIWKQYSYIYGKQKYIESKLLKVFYATYAATYERVSVFAARLDELNADRYAMDLYVHDDVREMISADAMSRWYLQKRFWPAINKIAQDKSKLPLTPYRKLTSLVKSNFTDEKIRVLKKHAYRELPEFDDRVPSLKTRLENIGHETPYMKENKKESAAEVYLGASLNGALNLMDKLWLKKNKKKTDTSKSLRSGWVPALKKS